MKKFLDTICKNIIENNMIEPKERIVLGVSGGADSVCLLLVLCELAKRLQIEIEDLFVVHVNHGIRGEDARQDEIFVETLCKKLGVAYTCVSYDVLDYAKNHGLSVEEAGRMLRYQAFSEIATKHQCLKIAVAHNKNDLAETVIFNMIRGTGMQGLCGITAVRDNIIRPLLAVTRTEIEQFLKECKQEYKIDATNLSMDYTRNIIRHKLLPIMEEMNDGAISHIVNMSSDAKEELEYLRQETELAKNKLNYKFMEEKGRIEYLVKEILSFPNVIQKHILQDGICLIAGRRKDVTRKHVEAVWELLSSETGKSVDLPYDMVASRSYEWLIIEKKCAVINRENIKENISITGPGVYDIGNQGSLWIEIIKASEFPGKQENDNFDIPKKTYTKIVDYGKIKDRLLIRKPEEGDYIVIDTSGNRKKLSRIFVDNKIAREQRKTWPVVAVGHEILWAIGLRNSEAFRVEKDTKEILVMNFKKLENT